VRDRAAWELFDRGRCALGGDAWLDGLLSGWASSSFFGSGDAELDPALLSKSSNRFLSFLPVNSLACYGCRETADMDIAYGNSAERSCSVFCVVRPGQRSSSSPRWDSHWR